MAITGFKIFDFRNQWIEIVIQLFSRSVSSGFEFYRKRGKLLGSEQIQEFTSEMDSLFDTLNSRLPTEGLKLNSQGIKVINNYIYLIILYWMNQSSIILDSAKRFWHTGIKQSKHIRKWSDAWVAKSDYTKYDWSNRVFATGLGIQICADR